MTTRGDPEFTAEDEIDQYCEEFHLKNRELETDFTSDAKSCQPTCDEQFKIFRPKEDNDSMDSKTSFSSSTKHQLVLSPPIFTDIVTRDGMTIIKLDSLAINHLRTAGNTNDNNPHYYHWATTGPVKIKPIGMPKIKVTIKM